MKCRCNVTGLDLLQRPTFTAFGLLTVRREFYIPQPSCVACEGTPVVVAIGADSEVDRLNISGRGIPGGTVTISRRRPFVGKLSGRIEVTPTIKLAVNDSAYRYTAQLDVYAGIGVAPSSRAPQHFHHVQLMTGIETATTIWTLPVWGRKEINLLLYNKDGATAGALAFTLYALDVGGPDAAGGSDTGIGARVQVWPLSGATDSIAAGDVTWERTIAMARRHYLQMVAQVDTSVDNTMYSYVDAFDD